MDELAHSNAPGSRHEKRWQDVEEILESGIDVYTTVNIQHFESLNDVVAQITGITVRETVPHRLLDLAFEIKLIDIPPEDLIHRLNEGKIYIPDQAVRAIEKFFRPDNLMALRELSLRRTAARVDDQMRAYMETQSITGPWQTAERLLACVSGSPYSEKLIRSTCRLAEELKAQWFTAYIETPSSGKHARENRERIWQNLRLAEGLGAQIATITATNVTDAVLEYAGRHNITKIVMGKPSKPRWREIITPPVVDRIIRRSGSVDVVIVSFEQENAVENRTAPKHRRSFELRGYAASLALVAAASVLCELLRPYLAPTNMVMFYLLAVVVASVRLERRPAIATAFLGVLAFDFFFVPPRMTFVVADTQYLLTFLGLFVVGVVISTLVARARERAEVMRAREVQTASRYYLSRDLAASANIDAVLKAVLRNVEEALDAHVVILLPEGERLDIVAASEGLALDIKEQAVADWAFRNNLSDQARRDLLDSACSEAERLNRFVGNLLDMTRIEAGAIRPNTELCDVQDLVGCALAAVEQRIGNRTVTILLPDDLPLISMDLVLMTQVLVNLLENSHKYSPHDSPIEMTASVDGSWLVIKVADHGPGVTDHDLKRIFDKFYRIPIPEGTGGTGLGLSICKGIIEAHSGSIRAENRTGGGLKTVIRLPLVQ